MRLDSSLIIDDSTLDKKWPPHNELAGFHWSGNSHKVIRGISLVNMLAAHHDTCIPVDYRVYEGTEGAQNKNERFVAFLRRSYDESVGGTSCRPPIRRSKIGKSSQTPPAKRVA